MSSFLVSASGGSIPAQPIDRGERRILAPGSVKDETGVNRYLLFLETLYAVAKKTRVEGLKSIVKHTDDPSRSLFFSAAMAEEPTVTSFMCDALQMVAGGVSLDEVTFYMEGHRHRLISSDKADTHLVNLVFRTVWAIAHGNWDAITCTEFGRATIPAAHSMSRKEWIAYCNSLEIERTQTNINWDALLKEIRPAS
jgi:flagellar motor component MotA